MIKQDENERKEPKARWSPRSTLEAPEVAVCAAVRAWLVSPSGRTVGRVCPAGVWVSKGTSSGRH